MKAENLLLRSAAPRAPHEEILMHAKRLGQRLASLQT
jgi:hypothetical protein